MTFEKSRRARGSNRGGTGGGYEPTDPDWEHKRLARMKAEYNSLDKRWQKVYLDGLCRADRARIEEDSGE